MTLISRWKSLATDKRGAAMVMFGLACPMVLGAAGLATDTIQWSLWKRELQRSADSGALAGAFAVARGADATAATNRDLLLTYARPLTTKVIENAPTSGAFSGDTKAVRVVLTYTKSLPFSSLFMADAPVITASATASVLDDGNYCIIALDDSTLPGIEVNGSSNISMGCGVASNSNAANAVTFAGNASRLLATPVAAVGGLSGAGNYVGATTLKPYSVPQTDPFAGLPEPTLPSCSAKVTVQPGNTRNLSPGCYRGLDIKGALNLAPGTYYVDGGTVDFGSQALITGAGVTIILTSSTAATNSNSIARLEMNGGARINLSAPSSGTYSGVLIYQDRRASTGTNTINGNASSMIQGAIYMPKQNIEMSGNSGMTTNCLQLVGKRIAFTGNSSISNSCPANSGTRTFTGIVVRLVE